MTHRAPSWLTRAAPLLACLSLAACQTAPSASGTSSTTAAASVTRYANAGPGAITSKAVEISSGHSLIFVSGNTPTPAQPNAAQYSPEYWGDTEAQTKSAFKKIEAALKDMKLSMADVVKVQVFLVAPDGAKMADAAGFGKGFISYFGAYSQGMLPSRTVVQVAALGRPGMLVEIEVTAARATTASAAVSATTTTTAVAMAAPAHAGHTNFSGHP